MAKRPSLSEESFLGHLFSPAKKPLPTGLRKTKLKGAKGQHKGRVAAYNRMTPFKQELLKRSGTRDAYLRGESTLAEAKNALRPSAIAKKLARPLRSKPSKTAAPELTDLDKRIAQYIITTMAGRENPINPQTVYDQNPYLGDNAEQEMLHWNAGEIKHAGRSHSEYEVVDNDGVIHNPFWYH